MERSRRFGNDVFQRGMPSGEIREDRRRAVGGMVVHDEHVEGEIGPLRQRAFHRVCDGPDAVPHRNDDARLHGKGVVRRRNVPERRGKPGPDPLEMRRRRRLHLLLERPVTRIDVGKVHPVPLCGADRPGRVRLRHRGEALREMEEFPIG